MSDHTNGLHVTSWGWADENGQTAHNLKAATFRLWRVSRHNKLIGYITLPADVGVGEAFDKACNGMNF